MAGIIGNKGSPIGSFRQGTESYYADASGAFPIAGSGVTITPLQTGANNVGLLFTVSGSAPPFAWTVAPSSLTMVANNGYIATSASLVVLTLPSGSSVGSVFRIVGVGSGGWQVSIPGGTTVLNTPTAATVSISSTQQYNCLDLLCVASNTFLVTSVLGGPFYL